MAAEKYQDPSEEPFLEPATRLAARPHGENRRRSRWSPYLLIHMAVFALYAGTFSILYEWARGDGKSGDTFLGTELKQEVPTNFTTIFDSPYAGSPTAETEAAWARLLEGINIGVTGDELSENRFDSVPLGDRKDEYLAWPEALHQVHCVKRLREWVYRDHFHPDLTEDETHHWMLHVDHCVELLRQAVICNADLGFMTFAWDDSTPKPMLRLEGPEHRCIDWDAYTAQLRPRRVGHDVMKKLRNPAWSSGDAMQA